MIDPVRIVNEDGQVSMMFGDYPQSRMDTSDPYSGGLEYTEAFNFAFLLKPDAKKVLVLGLGGGTIPKNILRDYPDPVVDVVEVSEEVVRLAAEHFSVEANDRMQIITNDARRYVEGCSDHYDIILMDAYIAEDGRLKVPQHLATQEFFSAVKRILSRGGVFVFNAVGRLGGRASNTVLAVLNTLSVGFSSVYLIEACISLNTLAFASEVCFVPPHVLAKRADALNMPHLAQYVCMLFAAPTPTKDARLLTDASPLMDDSCV